MISEKGSSRNKSVILHDFQQDHVKCIDYFIFIIIWDQILNKISWEENFKCVQVMSSSQQKHCYIKPDTYIKTKIKRPLTPALMGAPRTPQETPPPTQYSTTQNPPH